MASNNYGSRGRGGGGGGAWGRGGRGRAGIINGGGGGDSNVGRRYDGPPSNSAAGPAWPTAGAAAGGGGGGGGGAAAAAPPAMDRGAPDGRRGIRRPRYIPTEEERHDVVPSKPVNYSHSTGKMGVTGQTVNLMVNYFTLTKRTDWCIYNHRVDFKPEEVSTKTKKYLLKQHGTILGPYIFDGSTLYTANRLHPDPMLLYSTSERTGDRFELSIRLIQELDPGDVATIQFFNITLRKSLSAMGLEQVDRHFFDRQRGFRLEDSRLEIWPGFKTTMRNHEHNVLLCVEVAHKVFRLDTVLESMEQLSRGDWRHPETQAEIREELVGQVVMTSYNGKTYRIDDINWDTTASSGFEQRVNGVATQVSYIDYYRTRYNKNITERNQPLLVSRRSRRDIHRGLQGDILLVPELCQLTGLNDKMRKNFNLMKELAETTNLSPQKRVDRIEAFMRKLKSTPMVREDLQRWGLNFSDSLVEVKGRVIPQEPILFRGDAKQAENQRLKGDWTEAFRKHKLLQTPSLANWIVVVTQRDRTGVDNLMGTMQRVATPLGFQISRPLEIISISNSNPQTYASEIQRGIQQYKPRGLQLVFVILATDKQDTYAAVKRKCTNEHGIASQCMLAKHLDPRKSGKLMSVATKVVVQMSAKLGGVPWTVSNPIPGKTMILGFDVHHCGRRVRRSVGALVATTNNNFGEYFSAVSFHENREEVSANICQDVTKCLHAFMANNENALPNRIIMYRDGVGEGQLSYIYNTELEQIKTSLKLTYEGAKKQPPKLTFIIVTKRINTRIFTAKPKVVNPDPGTVVDDQITLPERYDFFLVSANAKQGTTVSPTSYNVLFDQQGVAPDTIQKLTYRLCHLYYNWSGTVAVPAPVQYAHRLAFQAGTSLDRPPNEALSHQLHFL